MVTLFGLLLTAVRSALTKVSVGTIGTLRRVAVSLKHVLLGFAHPLPSNVTIRGRDGGLESHVVKHVACVHRFQELKVAMVCDTTAGDLTIRLDDDDEVTGALAAIRYIGRVSRTYPTNPVTALCVDRGLDIFQVALSGFTRLERDFLVIPTQLIVNALETAEGHLLSEHDTWMEGFQGMTILDACWFGLIEWIVLHDLCTEKSVEEEFSRLNVWWKIMASRKAKEESEEESEEERAEEEGKKNT